MITLIAAEESGFVVDGAVISKDSAAILMLKSW